MLMRWKNVSVEQYEKARKIIKWETDVPEGAIFHSAGMGKNGFRVADVWESEEDFNNFTKNRLMDGLKQVGIEEKPEIEIIPLHAIFTPGL